MEKVQFSKLKILGQMDRVHEYTCGYNIAPVTVEFHLTNGCNHDCWFCSDAVRRDAGKGAKLPWEVIYRLLHEFEHMGVKSIVFEGGGEPTSHPQFVDAFRLAKELGMECGLTTHGGLLKDEVRRSTVAECASWVRMSIDSASNNTHSLMHRFKPNEFGTVLDNAMSIRERNRDVVLGWSFIISEVNFEEVFKAAQLAENIGFSYIDFKPLLVNRSSYAFPEEASKLLAMALELDGATSNKMRAHPFRVYAARIDGSAPYKPSFTVCQSHRFIANVAATGDVFVCCAHAMLEGDARPIERDRVVLGNVYDSTFRAIWEGEKRMAVIQDFMNPDTVKRCPSCRFGHHNEVLEAITTTGFSPFL